MLEDDFSPDISKYHYILKNKKKLSDSSSNPE